MEVPVTCHGNFLYSVLVNVTPTEHESILKYKWYKLKGQPVAHGSGNLFNLVSNLRKPGENLFPDLVPIGNLYTLHSFHRHGPAWDEVEVLLDHMVEAHPPPRQGRHLTRGS